MRLVAAESGDQIRGDPRIGKIGAEPGIVDTLELPPYEWSCAIAEPSN